MQPLGMKVDLKSGEIIHLGLKQIPFAVGGWTALGTLVGEGLCEGTLGHAECKSQSGT